MFLVKYYIKEPEKYDSECIISVHKNRSEYYYFSFKKYNFNVLSGLESKLLNSRPFSVEFLDARTAHDDFYELVGKLTSKRLEYTYHLKFKWSVCVPNLNYIYHIVRDWNNFGEFNLSDYYDIPWYNGGY